MHPKRLIVIAFAVACATSASPSRAGDDAALARCRAIGNDAERLACYDAALDRLAGEPAPSAAPATPAPTAEDLFGRDPVIASEAVQRSSGIEPLEQLAQRIAGARTDGSGRPVLTLENGQVWLQLDSPPVRFEAGEAVRIRRAAFGSYLLVRDRGGRSIRVRRLQ